MFLMNSGSVIVSGNARDDITDPTALSKCLPASARLILGGRGFLVRTSVVAASSCANKGSLVYLEKFPVLPAAKKCGTVGDEGT